MATVLVVMAVLAVIALTLASSTTFHLRLATRQSMGDQARNLADSVTAKAIDLIVDQRDLGAGTPSEDDVISARFSEDGPSGILSFYPPVAEEHGVPVSVNNLENDASVALPDGRTLPPFSALLVSKAEYGGVAKVVETVITIPKYKYALATSGTISSNGRLLVASIDEDADLSGGLNAIPPEDLKPGHLAALGNDETVLDAANPAVGTLITGDVVSGGGVTLGAYTDVRGAVKQNHEPEDLPTLDLADYDPAGWAGLQTVGSAVLPPPSPFDPVVMEGVWRREGDLQFTGGLKLDGGYLYVDGDLTINGRVSGKGSIFCTGDISVGQASGFAADNVQALVAGGSISISGGNNPAARDNSFFSGILFSHGGMNLSNVSVVGSVVNNSPEPTEMQLNNVALLQRPDVVDFDFGFPGASRSDEFSGTSDNNYAAIPQPTELSSFFSAGDDAFIVPQQDDIPLSVFITSDVGNDFQEPEFLGQVPDRPALLDLIVAQGYVNVDLSIPSTRAQVESALDTQVFQYRENVQDAVRNADEIYQRTRQESLKNGQFKLEPNQFLPFEDKVKVVWSRELPSS